MGGKQKLYSRFLWISYIVNARKAFDGLELLKPDPETLEREKIVGIVARLDNVYIYAHKLDKNYGVSFRPGS